MLASLFGYFLSMIAMLTAAMVVLTSFSNISTKGHARQNLRPPVIGRIDEPHSQVAKEETRAKDVSPVVATAKADTKKIKHYKPKVLARQRNNYGYGNARGYASGYGPSGLFFR